MVMIHLSQYVDCIGIKIQIRIIYNTQGIKLMAQGTFSKHELHGICAIKAVDTVGSANTILESDGTMPRDSCVMTISPMSKQEYVLKIK
jgi:hypothetical protein